MIFCRLVIFFFIFLFFQTNLFLSSAEECDDFYEAVLKKDNIPFPEIKKNDLAIFFDYQWNKGDSKVSIKRDNKNYPVVRISLFEDKLLPGTIIKAIGGINLSTTKDDDIINMITKSGSSVIEYFAENEVNKIKDELSENFVTKVKLDYKYDPSLIGGLIIQVGSVMIDTSIQSKLKQLENKMIEA